MTPVSNRSSSARTPKRDKVERVDLNALAAAASPPDICFATARRKRNTGLRRMIIGLRTSRSTLDTLIDGRISLAMISKLTLTPSTSKTSTGEYYVRREDR